MPNLSNSGAFHFHLGKAELVVKSGKGEGIGCWYRLLLKVIHPCRFYLQLHSLFAVKGYLNSPLLSWHLNRKILHPLFSFPQGQITGNMHDK